MDMQASQRNLRLARIVAVVTLTIALPRATAAQSAFQEELDLTAQLINQVPLPMDDGNPLVIIRAVNHLHSIGKENAVKALRTYAERSAERDPFSDQRCRVIVPILFQPVDRDQPLPPDEWYDRTNRRWKGVGGWPEFVVEADVPFDISGRYSLGGHLPPTVPLVDWAAKHGIIRKHPLRPTGNPLDAADTLHAKLVDRQSLDDLIRYRGGYTREELNEWMKRHLHKQAFQLVSGVIGDSDAKPWNVLKQELEKNPLFWQDDKQQYVKGMTAK